MSQVQVVRARRLFGPDRLLIKPRVRDPELLARVRSLAPDLFVSSPNAMTATTTGYRSGASTAMTAYWRAWSFIPCRNLA